MFLNLGCVQVLWWLRWDDVEGLGSEEDMWVSDRGGRVLIIQDRKIEESAVFGTPLAESALWQKTRVYGCQHLKIRLVRWLGKLGACTEQFILDCRNRGGSI